MHIQISTGTTTLNATLNDSAAAADLAALLPLTVTLSDFHSTEKIADLPSQLSTVGTPSGAAAKIGDIAYYSPWGNLAIFYHDFEYAPGLVLLGHIDGPLGAIITPNDGPTITIAAVDRELR